MINKNNTGVFTPRYFFYILFAGCITFPVRNLQKRSDDPGGGQRLLYIPILILGDVKNMEEIISLIQNLGFPIACTVALFIMLKNEQKEHKEETQKLTDTISDLKMSFANAINEQKSDMVSAINNNTLVIQKLLDRLDDEK